MATVQALRQTIDVFYRYDLVAGRYDYIIPATEYCECILIDEWMVKGVYGTLSLVHPDDQSKVQTHIRRLREATADSCSQSFLEYRIKARSGCYHWVSDSHAVLFDTRGRANVVIGNLRDTTREKQTEDARQQLAHIVSASNDYLSLIDRNYTYRAISTVYAQSFNKKPDEIIGNPVSGIMGEELFENIIKPMADRCLDGEKLNFQLWYNFPDGKRRFFDIVYSPHYEKGQKLKTVIGFVECARDITLLKRLEDQVRQSGKMEAIGVLAGGIAHDFNNILSAITGYAEMSLQLTSKECQMHYNLRKILQASHRAADLVGQILTFSRKNEQELIPVQVSNIASEVLKLIRASLPATIEINENIQSDSFIMGDATQIYQILMNLCTNAAYAMRKKGGLLTVNLFDIVLDSFFTNQYPELRPGNYLQLTVKDNGEGMQPEIKDQIFDPFFTSKEKGKGTGIGLSLTHDIIKSYGGIINVHSVPDKGTTFNVFIPVIESAIQEDTDNEEILPMGKEHILFVDDEGSLADLGKQMIESMGYKVTARVSSLDALQLFKDDPYAYDLVITDLIMPKMTGDVLAEKILEIRPDTPIILATGFSEQVTPEKAQSLGVAKYVRKPIVMRDIAKFIREALGR